MIDTVILFEQTGLNIRLHRRLKHRYIPDIDSEHNLYILLCPEEQLPNNEEIKTYLTSKSKRVDVRSSILFYF